MEHTVASRDNWTNDQKYEREWWGECVNTYAEETKQLSYAHRMGLVNNPQNGQWPVYDLEGKSIIDIGGGPASMLLKTVNGGEMVVIDPCDYPTWTLDRYRSHEISYYQKAGEDIDSDELIKFDEAWIYNCLQHTMDPKKIIENARKIAKVVRIFEWVNIPPHEGHPHELKAELLDKWLDGRGTVEKMDENGANATAYYGCFKS